MNSRIIIELENGMVVQKAEYLEQKNYRICWESAY